MLPRIHSKDPQPKRTKSNIPPRSPPCSFVFISTCEQHLTKIYRDFSQNLAFPLSYNYGRQFFLSRTSSPFPTPDYERIDPCSPNPTNKPCPASSQPPSPRSSMPSPTSSPRLFTFPMPWRDPWGQPISEWPYKLVMVASRLTKSGGVSRARRPDSASIHETSRPCLRLSLSADRQRPSG